MKDFLKKGKAKSNDNGNDGKEKPAKKPLFGGGKSDKSTKKGGGLGFGKKPTKKEPNLLDNDIVYDDDLPEKPAFSLKDRNTNKGNDKAKAKTKKGKGGGLDLGKMDTKKLIMGLGAVLVVLVLLLVVAFVMGGGDNSSEQLPPPEMASEPVSEPALAEPPPVETPPMPAESAPAPAPVEPPPVAVVPPPTQAQQPVQVAPQTQQPARPVTTPMTREEFESGTDKIYRERSTTPPTASR